MKINKYLPLFIVLSLFSTATTVFAQQPVLPERGTVNVHFSNIGLSRFNGLKVGADYVMLSKEVVKSKKGKPAETLQSVHALTFNYAVYSRSLRYTNHLVHVGYLIQKTNNSGWFTGVEPFAGIKLSNRPTSGDQNFWTNSVSRSLTTGVSLGVGKDFSYGRKALPISVFGKYSLMTSFPRARLSNLSGFTEIGVSYTINRKKE